MAARLRDVTGRLTSPARLFSLFVVQVWTARKIPFELQRSTDFGKLRGPSCEFDEPAVICGVVTDTMLLSLPLEELFMSTRFQEKVIRPISGWFGLLLSPGSLLVALAGFAGVG
ncbi:MAG UNVERIFIED_CONTAM: hypothetical protein LVR18_29270 [Planctomycetaceae bacterium]|jgi:hypothetical protein